MAKEPYNVSSRGTENTKVRDESTMKIRKSTEADFERIMEIYRYARNFMADHGNPRQWGISNWPPEDLIHSDILQKKGYVCTHEGRVVGTFFFDYGKEIESTYHTIEDGKWLDDSAYGVVHRLAGDGSVKGIGKFCLEWACRQCGHLRVDTHGDNLVMQSLLPKLGFQYCGMIYVTVDNDPRLAYEIINREKCSELGMVVEKAVIFDLDGTLWNAAGSACDIWNRVLERHGDITVRVTQKMAESVMGKTMKEIGEILLPECTGEVREKILDEIGKEEVRYLEKHGAVLYDGMKETIASLHEEYGLYIVSNCQDGYVPAFLHAHQMERYFKDIEMSGRTGLDKGKNIRLLMEKNHIKSAVYVGDTQGDEKAAEDAGIPFIYAAYGFGKAVSPDAAVDSIKELPKCLDRFFR